MFLLIYNDPEVVKWIEDNPQRGGDSFYRPVFLSMMDDSICEGSSVVTASMIVLDKETADDVTSDGLWRKLYD